MSKGQPCPTSSGAIQRYKNRQFRIVLPEAICCCLQTCYVDVLLLLMDFMCIPTFIVVTALVV